MQGTVKFYDSKKGWGFITDSEGKDVFVHQSDIQMNGFRILDHGDVVTFDLGVGNDGREQAVNATPILTMKMVKKALKEDNLYVRSMKNGYYSVKRYQVVDQNKVLQSSEEGMSFLELAAYAGFDTEGLAG